MRALNEKFMSDLLNGSLTPILNAVRSDDTLVLELRGTYVNVYYRGGSLYRIDQKDGYVFFTFDTDYGMDDISLPEHPTVVEAPGLIYQYKAAMDKFLTLKNPKMEREFQQLMTRLNNRAKIGKASDYYIMDIEYADTDERGLKAKFDMVALKWPCTKQDRKITKDLSLALIELKYGDGALGGTAGIEKHLDDLADFLGDAEKLKDFCLDMGAVFRQKCELGLVPTVPEHKREVTVTAENPEVILAVADHDPAKPALANVLSALDLNKYNFSLRIATASLLGGALFVECMLPIPKYLQMDGERSGIS